MSKPAIKIYAGDFKAGSPGRFLNGTFVLLGGSYLLENTRIRLDVAEAVEELKLYYEKIPRDLSKTEILFVAQFDDGKRLLASMDTATFNHERLSTRVVTPVDPPTKPDRGSE